MTHVVPVIGNCEKGGKYRPDRDSNDADLAYKAGGDLGIQLSHNLANPAQRITAAAVSPYLRQAYVRAFPHTDLAKALSGSDFG